jgi:hypothetical protein
VNELFFTRHVSRLSVDGGELEQVGPSKFSKLNGITGYKKTDIRKGNLIMIGKSKIQRRCQLCKIMFNYFNI